MGIIIYPWRTILSHFHFGCFYKLGKAPESFFDEGEELEKELWDFKLAKATGGIKNLTTVLLMSTVLSPSLMLCILDDFVL